MKKLSVLCLILTLSLIFTGCGGEAPVRGTVETQPAQTAQTVPAQTEDSLGMGTLEGGSYVNSYAGFAIDLDESWVFRGAEELQDLPETVWSAMDGSQLAKEMEGVEQFTDMQAENAALMGSVNVVYSKQDLASRLAFQVMSDEEVVDGTLSQQDLMKEAYTQAGIEVSAMEKVKVTFLGRDTWALKTTAKIQDLDYYALQLFNYRAGAYGVTLTCSTFVEDRTEELAGLFYEVE